MRESTCDVLIVGGGTGGVAAALALAGRGLKVVMTEPTTWIGGQLTAQLVPPDEHPWIEQCGCTATYRAFREGVRAAYRRRGGLTSEAAVDRYLNPGQGWVSRLCFEPKVGLAVLEQMLAPMQASGELTIHTRCAPISADSDGERVRAVTFRDLDSGDQFAVAAKVVLDATELGHVLPLTGTEYRIGAESKAETGEAHAVDGLPQPDNVQGITWCFAMGYDPAGDHRIDRPAAYSRWKAFAPEFWAGPLLSWNTIHAHTGEPFTWTLFADEHPRVMGLFDYRQIVSSRVMPGAEEATIVNWPQNDYYTATTLDVSETELAGRFAEAKELSLCLLYWLQHEAPRPDGGEGYPGLRLRPDLSGTDDGFAPFPYIRESRRIVARHTVLEQHVSAHDNPGKMVADPVADSVGIGAYRIDLHPSTSGAPTVDFSSLPFQIPMGSLIPVRMRNLLPAAKNLGVTHITNGCYRLHPVEWNIGEAAGALAGFAIAHGCDPIDVYERPALRADYLRHLEQLGIERDWPRLRAL